MKRRRTAIALAGFLVMLGPGTISAYSIFVQPLLASMGWGVVQSVWAFALNGCFFGAGALLGGLRLEQEDEDARRVTVAGLGLWALGNTLAALTATGSGPAWILVGYGVLGGFGSGMAYIAALCVIIKWFPDKRGIGVGTTTMGFGFGACAYASALTHFSGTPSVNLGMELFILSGAVFFLLSLCGLSLVGPPDDSPHFIPTGKQTTGAELLRNPQAYIQWTMFFLTATAGTIVVAHAAPIMAEQAHLPLWSARFFLLPAFCLGLGHVVGSALSDRIDYRLNFGGIFILSSFLFFALGGLHAKAAVMIALSLLFFCYGASLGSMPGLTADFFGVEHFSTNYGMMMTAWGAAAFFAPLFCSVIKDLTGSYAMGFQPIGLILLTAIVFPIMGEPTPKRKAAEPLPDTPTRRLQAPTL